MVDYTRTVLYLGNRADADPIEGSASNPQPQSNNLAALSGTYTASDGMQILDVTYRDRSRPNQDNSPNGQIEENTAYNTSGQFFDGTTQDRVIYDLGNGQVTTRLDSLQLVNATVTQGDGTTVKTQFVITQMTNGDVFLTEYPDGTLDNISIQSVTIETADIDTTYYSALFIPPNIVNSSVVCFAEGTQILTDEGDVAVEELQAGDVIWTADNGLKPLSWVGKIAVDSEALAANEKLRPIRIRAGALGAGKPSVDLLVSPQHRVLVRSKIARRMFGEGEVLVAAKELTALEGISVADDVDQVTYHHLMFDQHEVVAANGAEAESLYLGKEALKALDDGARREIFTLFPHLMAADYAGPYARAPVRGKLARRLVGRHKKNLKPLVA